MCLATGLKQTCALWFSPTRLATLTVAVGSTCCNVVQNRRRRLGDPAPDACSEALYYYRTAREARTDVIRSRYPQIIPRCCRPRDRAHHFLRVTRSLTRRQSTRRRPNRCLNVSLLFNAAQKSTDTKEIRGVFLAPGKPKKKRTDVRLLRAPADRGR